MRDSHYKCNIYRQKKVIEIILKFLGVITIQIV